MPAPRRHRFIFRITLTFAGIFFCAQASAFGEEHGSGMHAEELVSTHHLYLTRALAVCAGFASNGNDDPFIEPADAERIAIADQLSDSERLRHGDSQTSNCSGQPYVMPTPAQLGCRADSGTRSIMPVLGKGHFTGWLPVPTWRAEEGCFTSRFGPYSNDFHFPDAARLEILRAWAFGESSTLSGTARFSFGGFFDSPWGADCNATRNETISTGAITPGSLDALGIYLHAIGDFHSHAECLAHWGDRKNPPWPTHTISTAQTGCAFIDHARELGCPADSAHDKALLPAPATPWVPHAESAAMAVYDALKIYATKNPANVTPRLGDSTEQRAWLARQVHRFVTGWPWLGGAPERAAFANALAHQCAALQPAQMPAGLPVQPGESLCASGN